MAWPTPEPPQLGKCKAYNWHSLLTRASLPKVGKRHKRAGAIPRDISSARRDCMCRRERNIWLLVVHAVCPRSNCITLRPDIPPLKSPLSFACSVASLSQFPGHDQPGHRSVRRVAPAECHLGWDKPSSCSARSAQSPTLEQPPPTHTRVTENRDILQVGGS